MALINILNSDVSSATDSVLNNCKIIIYISSVAKK